MQQPATIRKYGGPLGDVYRKFVRGLLKSELGRQRFKLLYDIWGYTRLLGTDRLGLRARLSLLRKLLRIDWNVVHGHKPCEITPLLLELLERPAMPGEAFVEAGCWNGGSSAKFSIVCKMLGYELHVFDSFQGVKEWNFACAATEGQVRENVERYGCPEVCTYHAGWFKDTLLNRPVAFPVRMVYVDCDVPNGTKEALSGLMPRLVVGGVIYTQDYHIDDVREVYHDPETWRQLGVASPAIEYLVRNIARVEWPRGTRPS